MVGIIYNIVSYIIYVHNSLVEKIMPLVDKMLRITSGIWLSSRVYKILGGYSNLVEYYRWSQKDIGSDQMEFDSKVVTAIVILLYWKKIVDATRYPNDITLGL